MAKHDRESLFRYLARDLTDGEKIEVESHVKDCRECSDFLSFAGGLKTALREMAPEELAPDTPCPDADMLVAFAAGQLEEKEAQLVRKHAVFCKDCLEELDLVRETTESAGIRPTEASWREIIERLKEFVIDLGKTYGPGALVGSVEILVEKSALYAAFAHHEASCAESPVTRRKAYYKLPRGISKTVKVSVGENAYSIKLDVREDAVLCEIATLRAPLKLPLGISVRSGPGEELLSAKTDEFGFSHFRIAADLLSDNLYVFILSLRGVEQQLLFRLPQEQEPEVSE